MLVGRLTKDSADEARVTVDFFANGWLDSFETISVITTPVVIVDQQEVWQFGQYVTTPPPPPVDSTPLLVANSFIVSGGQQVQLLLTVGTPGLTYKITFVATGSSSNRQKQIDIICTVNEPY